MDRPRFSFFFILNYSRIRRVFFILESYIYIMVVTQSDKLVKCPKCEEIKKATGEKYFICCRTRWDLQANRLNNSEDSSDEHNETTRKEDERSRGSGDQSQSNDKTRSNQSNEPGEKSGSKTLEF